MWTKVYNMPSQYTKIKVNGWMQPVEAYTIDWSTNRQQLIDAARVYHYKKFNPQYSQEGHNLYGLSPMSSLCKVVTRSNENYDAGLALIQNGMPAGILAADKGGRPMTPDEIELADKKMKSKFGGGKNKSKIMTTSAPLKWQAMGLNVGDLQLLESNKADAQDIAKAYGVPLPLIESDASTFNNVEEAKKFIWQNVLMPDLQGFAQGFGDWLLEGYRKQSGKNLVLDFDASNVPALQDDLNTLSTRLLGEMEKGIWTGNEVKRMLGRPTDANAPHLDEYLIANNLTKLNNNEDGQTV
jgi:HK97 family phage portal protein